MIGSSSFRQPFKTGAGKGSRLHYLEDGLVAYSLTSSLLTSAKVHKLKQHSEGETVAGLTVICFSVSAQCILLSILLIKLKVSKRVIIYLYSLLFETEDLWLPFIGERR